jgi:WD40 repeat protein
MQTWEHLRTWPADVQRLSQLVFTPDGSALVSLGTPDAVSWDPESGLERTRARLGIPASGQFAISPDSQYIAAPAWVRGAAPPYAIRLWKLADGTVHKTIAHPSAANRGQLAFAGSSDTLIMGGGKGMTVWDLATSKLTANLGSKTLHDVPLAVHPDSQRVAMQPWSGPIEVWDITTQKKLISTTVHGGKTMVTNIAIHPGGKWAASAGEDGAVCLWDFGTGVVAKKWQLGPAKGIVHQVAFSPDGRYLATVNGNGTAYILRMDETIER